MMRNDYRRALILLRGSVPGYSGHVRLERRTMMGSMYFLLQAPTGCEKLRAALVGRNRDGYYACALGEAQRNARGQAVLSYSFDPRNICNRALEDYQMFAVSCADAQDCEIVLYGNVSGYAEMNWEQARMALCELYGGEAAQDVQALAPPEDSKDKSPEAPMQEADGEVSHNFSQEANKAYTAGEALQLDMNVPWPQSVEAVRPLFKTSVPMESPPDEEYVYIAASMPPESGYAYCAVGVLAQDGAPVSLRYALPAQWTAEAPAGLEEYSWVGNANRGWWMTQVDLPNNSAD